MANASLSDSMAPTDSPSEYISIFDATDPQALISYVIDVLNLVQDIAAVCPEAFEDLAQPQQVGDGIYFLVTCLTEGLKKALEGMKAERVQSRAGEKLTQTNSLPSTSSDVDDLVHALFESFAHKKEGEAGEEVSARALEIANSWMSLSESQKRECLKQFIKRVN